eukprot:3575596-Amphidinium_carterae.1
MSKTVLHLLRLFEIWGFGGLSQAGVFASTAIVSQLAEQCRHPSRSAESQQQAAQEDSVLRSGY